MNKSIIKEQFIEILKESEKSEEEITRITENFDNYFERASAIHEGLYKTFGSIYLDTCTNELWSFLILMILMKDKDNQDEHHR